MFFGRSSNGRTRPSGGWNLGSSPSLPARAQRCAVREARQLLVSRLGREDLEYIARNVVSTIRKVYRPCNGREAERSKSPSTSTAMYCETWTRKPWVYFLTCDLNFLSKAIRNWKYSCGESCEKIRTVYRPCNGREAGRSKSPSTTC